MVDDQIVDAVWKVARCNPARFCQDAVSLPYRRAIGFTHKKSMPVGSSDRIY